MESEALVWYACYGSNLLTARFHCYIAGGQPEGASRSYAGCRNKRLPTKSKPRRIHHQMYFAKSASGWQNGSVAFIKPQPTDHKTTLGKQYLLTREQFIDLAQQESNLAHPPSIDFEKARAQKQFTFADDPWYNHLIYLGNDSGFPIFTLTASRFFSREIKAPSPAYLKTIIRGLKNNYAWSEEELNDYLTTKIGIRSRFSPKELLHLIDIA